MSELPLCAGAPAPAHTSAAAHAAAAAAAGFEAQKTCLTARSFAALDLSKDSAVTEAIVALLSENRKRVWASVRLLESRFRDDLSIEFSRRWAVWMGMPEA